MKYHKSVTLLLLLLYSGILLSDNLSTFNYDEYEWTRRQEFKPIINKLKYAVSVSDIETVANMIQYPLRRENPVPDITSKKEFIKKYPLIFDDYLKDKIINSSTEKDWEVVGSRGAMLNDGILWISDSNLIIAINYQSDEESSLSLTPSQDIHASLKDYDYLVIDWKTKKHRVRIDHVDSYYRYASWPSDKPITEKPDIIIKNGEIDIQGTAGNRVFTFTNGHYKYFVYDTLVGGEETQFYYLEVYKDDKLLLNEDFKELLVTNR